MPEYRITLNEDGLTLQDEMAIPVDLETALALIDRLSEAYERPACVYVMQHNDLYKIGMTAQRIGQRLSQVRYDVEWGHNIEWLFSLPCRSITEARQLEARLHMLFAHQRMYGEWFKLTKEELEWIREGMSKETAPRHNVTDLTESVCHLLDRDSKRASQRMIRFALDDLDQIERWVHEARAELLQFTHKR